MKTSVHSVQAVYNELAKSYGTDAHKTTKLFHGTQRLAILLACRRTAATLGKRLEELDVLTIGVGDGQQRRDLCILSLGIYGQRIKDSRLTELDISAGMLQVAGQLHPRDTDYLAKYEDGRLPRQIQGDALTAALPDNSFDVVVGALIDHIPNQPALYSKVVGALRPKGVFVVTYPHRRLMEVIRREIYGIPVNRTRFIIRGKPYLIPSLALLPADASRFMRQAGTSPESMQNAPPAPRLLHRGNLPPQQTPVLADGVASAKADAREAIAAPHPDLGRRSETRSLKTPDSFTKGSGVIFLNNARKPTQA